MARTIDSLDEDLDENVERLWLDEATRRYGAYLRGETSSFGGGGICTSPRATQAVNLRFLDLAEEEMLEAARIYEDQAAGLGELRDPLMFFIRFIF